MSQRPSINDSEYDLLKKIATNTAGSAIVEEDGFTLADSTSIDAFSRLRVSNPVALFSSQCQYDSEPLLFESGNTGTGSAPAHSANTRMVALSVAAGSGTSFIQSYEYIPYQAGKSHLAFITFVYGAGVAGTTVDCGLFDTDNGIFFRQNGTTSLQFVRRSKTSGSVVDEAVPQSSWNIDKLDGTGPSGQTLNIAASQILVIDAQFLAMGRVRVGFDIGGVIVPCHQFRHANIIAVPYMQTLALPVHMLVTASGSGAGRSAHFKCASVSSEGGVEEDLSYAFSTPEQTVTAGSGARTHILSLRPLATFNSITNRVKIVPNEVSVMVTGNNPIIWELAVGSAFSAGPTFSAAGSSSAAEYSSAVGTVSAVGIVIASGYVSSSAQTRGAIGKGLSVRYPISLSRAGAVRANGTMSLFVTGIGGTSASRASIGFSEVR